MNTATIVVDASVAIKWFIPEIHALAASQLLTKQVKLLAPDLIIAEVGNILWKKHRLKELDLNDAKEILDNFQRLPLDIYETKPLINAAWTIAIEHQRTVYDSLYLALAETKNCPLITADRAFYNALQNSHLAPLVLWVEQVSGNR